MRVSQTHYSGTSIRASEVGVRDQIVCRKTYDRVRQISKEPGGKLKFHFELGGRTETVYPHEYVTLVAKGTPPRIGGHIAR
jgi:hypothetical protein